MSNLSELLPAGGGQNNFTFTASGAVSNGDPVVLNDDGTVSSVGTVSSALGTASVISTANASTTGRTASTVYHKAQEKIVHVYLLSNYVWAVVGTVSGSTVSYGTPVAVNSASSEKPRAVYDSTNEKVIVFYGSNAGGGQLARVVTVSGSTISVGNATLYDNSTNGILTAAFDESKGKAVVAWSDNNSSSYGKAKVGTVSGTSISFGSEATFESAYTSMESAGAVYDSTNERVVIVYMDSANSNTGSAVVCIISGTSISFGAVGTFGSGSIAFSSTFDSSTGKIVAVGRNSSNSYGAWVVGTVDPSDDSISFGTRTDFVFQNVSNRHMTIAYDAFSEKIVIGSSNSTDGLNLYTAKVKADASALVFDAPIVNLLTSTQSPGTMAYAENAKKTHICYVDTSISSNAIGRTFAPERQNLTSNTFIGLAGQAISDAAEGTVNALGSLNGSQSGLTIGDDYYVYEDGSLITGVLAFEIEGGSYDGVSLNTASTTGNIQSIRFNDDGTKLYVLGETSDSVYQYGLTTAYDISTASYDSVSFDFSSQDVQPSGMAFKPDGTKMYMVGLSNDTVYQYSLSTAFNVGTASYDSVSFSVSAQDTNPQDVAFKPDGTKMYVVGSIGDSVYQYGLTTAFDISTASYESTLDVSSIEANPRDLAFNNDGTKLFIIGNSADRIRQYGLRTAYDISTAYFEYKSLSVQSEETNPMGLAFNADGTKAYAAGTVQDTVFQYTSTTAYTDNKVGKAISATQINMKNRS